LLELLGTIFFYWVILLCAMFLIQLICAPTVAAFFINRWLVSKGIKYLGKTLIIFAPIWTVYIIYTAIYPTDSFYHSEFERITLIEIPNSAQILVKDASYPIRKHQYCSAAIIILSKDEYLKFFNDMSNDKNMSSCDYDRLSNSKEVDFVLSKYKKENIHHSFIRENYNNEYPLKYIGFFNDNKTIIINYCQ